MKNILYMIHTAGDGGSEEYVYKLIKNIDRNKFKAYLAYSKDGKLVEKLKNEGIEVFKIDMKSIIDIKSIFDIINIVKKYNIDIIHTQFARENYLSVIAKLFCSRIKVIYTNHIILNEGKLKKILNKFISKKNDAIIAVSEASKNKMISQNICNSKIQIIYNGVKIPKIINNDIRISIRKKYDISENEFVFINISRFSEEKGILELLDSIKLLNNLNINQKFKLFLVGDGYLSNEIKLKIDELLLDNVILTGYKNNTIDYLLASDLYINSSKNENLSFSIIEALSVGLPIIATNVGGNSEIISKESNVGILCEFDTVSMKDAMLKILNDRNLYINFKKNTIDYVKNKFDEDKMLEKTYELYK